MLPRNDRGQHRFFAIEAGVPWPSPLGKVARRYAGSEEGFPQESVTEGDNGATGFIPVGSGIPDAPLHSPAGNASKIFDF